MVSEMLYCQLDMTSSWFLRQRALHATLNDGFWKRDHDFLRAFNSNLLFGMHRFRDNEVLLQAGYAVIVISPPDKKKQKCHITRVYVAATWRLDRSSDPSQLRHGCLPNVITHVKFEISWYKIVTLVSCFSTATADAINTAKPIGLPVICLW